MTFDELKKQKEVVDFVKEIRDLTEQQNNPTRDGMEHIILSIKNKYKIETDVFETTTAFINKSVMTDIKYISDDVLYNRLSVYKEIVMGTFIKKYGGEVFNKLVIEYKLDV